MAFGIKGVMDMVLGVGVEAYSGDSLSKDPAPGYIKKIRTGARKALGGPGSVAGRRRSGNHPRASCAEVRSRIYSLQLSIDRKSVV